MRTIFEEVARSSTSLPYAALAAGPRLRSAAERRGAVAQSSTGDFTVERVQAERVPGADVCLSLPPDATEVLVVTLNDLAPHRNALAAAEAGMWWVDRCMAEVSTAAGAARLVCCVRVKEMNVRRLYLYSSADVGEAVLASVGAGSTAGVRRLRVPNAPFALQMDRMAELWDVQLSPSVTRRIVEVDVRSCLRWRQAEVNQLITSLNAPLRAVRVTTVSLPAIALLRRFYASLRVLHLNRCSAAIFHDAHGLVTYDDEEVEEEETRTDSAPNSAETSGKIPPPPPAPRAPLSVKSRKATKVAAAASKAGKAAKGSAGSFPAPRPRRNKLVLPLPAGATPVLEELHISASLRRALPRWIQQCLYLERLSLSGCCYTNLDALRGLTGLREVTLESCNRLAAFDVFCGFTQLRAISIQHCAMLRSISWLPRLAGALRSLTLHQHSSSSLILPEGAASGGLGIGLDCLQLLDISLPDMIRLTPLVHRAARMLRELTLFNCSSVEDFAALPPLPSLEKVCITHNRHMQNLKWLRGSPLLTELRATQCLHLSSLAGIGSCRKLHVLEVTGAVRLKDINGLESCTALAYVDLSQCRLLTNVSLLGHLKHLHKVLLRGCMQLSKDFEWLSECPALDYLMVPHSSWYVAASERLQQLNRSGSVSLQ
ncbi:hypothetical protein ABB37_09067 [Leptomonas pyrrhocoris]|uniref:Leucine-rich repeat protein (LRRP) n=1 Tax=Leptomonas pyrrhocoris TaxID=157538 RepID=A0A0N0DRQ1_LEPPY|nr:hypothetical protein ABB37_09067 [Leptomonas pyrrhocoris]KPA74784.1 hypothetical protein ABB37_09067 [Leptomonas pyrrhocoris]|eukprot:XP_015653223.1 hypothetical protein ABB37_09067 [Leptomonas pyrrhocoris]